MTKFTKILAGAFLAIAMLATTASAAYVQAGTLKQGSRNSQVLSLQQTLNMSSCKVALSGAGSMGMETTYFGPATKAAVKCFQASKGLVADGIVGPKTGAQIAMITGTPSNLPAGCTSTAGYSPINGMACNGNGTGPVQTGAVTVALSQDNPASGTIVSNQALADLMHVTFNGSGTVTSVTLKRSGLSSQNTFANVYLYDGAMRLTDGYSFNSTGDLTINGLNLAVNGSRTIAVKADASSTAAQDSTVAVALTSFTANGVTNVVNIMGNTFALSTASNLATVQYNGGTNTVGTAFVNSGTSNYAIFRQAIQVNQRTVLLKGANFRVTGSAPSSSLTNVKLYVDGVDTGKVATMSMMNGSNYISFDMMSAPFSLTTGSHTVELRADISGGSSYNFTVSLQQASDLMILDPQYGVNIAVTNTSGTSFSASTAGQISINPGSATITVDPTFSSMTNVTGGGSNVVVGKFKIRGYGEDVKVTSLPVTVALSAAATPAGVQNVSLYFNGSQVGSQVTLTSASGVPGTLATNSCATTPGTSAFTCYTFTFNLGSQLIIPANVDSTLEVRADIRNAAGTNYTAGTVQANLAAGTAEGMTSRNPVTTPAVSGTALTVQTGTLSVSANPAYTSQNVSPNMAGVKIGSFVVQNTSSSESVRVTNLAVALIFGAPQTVTNLSGLRTSENSNYQIQPQASNNFSVDFQLAPGATRTIDIFADTGSVTTGTVQTTLTVSSIGVSSNVSATSSAIAGQTITVASGSVNPPTVLQSSSTQSQYIATGTTTGITSGSRASFNFVGSGGSSTISELKVRVTSGTANQTPVASVTVNGVTAPVVATSTTTGEAYLTNLNIAVPNGAGGANVDVYLNYSAVGATGVTSGTTATAAITYVKATSGGSTTVSNPTVSAPTMTVVAARPTLTVNSTQQQGLILGAENKIGEVTITAEGGNIKINDIVFTAGNSGFTSPVYSAARIADGSTTISGSACTVASNVITCEFGTTSNTDNDGYLISTGSKTFNLYANVAGTAVAGATQTVSTSVSASGFNWDDAAGGGVNYGGALIYNFPSNSYSIRQ